MMDFIIVFFMMIIGGGVLVGIFYFVTGVLLPTLFGEKIKCPHCGHETKAYLKPGITLCKNCGLLLQELE